MRLTMTNEAYHFSGKGSVAIADRAYLDQNDNTAAAPPPLGGCSEIFNSASEVLLNTTITLSRYFVHDLDMSIEPDVETQFKGLRDAWKEETGMLSNVTKKCMHPAYQQIIGMGKEAVPYILKDLETSKDDWFWALWAITKHDPIPHEDAGNIDKMTEAWLIWGKGKAEYDV